MRLSRIKAALSCGLLLLCGSGLHAGGVDLPPGFVLDKPVNLKFYDNERIETGQRLDGGATRYRIGETPDGFAYRIWPEGNGDLYGYGVRWLVSCAKDVMTDRRNCFVTIESGGVAVLFASEPYPLYLCAIGNDFPGMKGMIRIDAYPAIETDTRGCADARALQELKPGSVIRTRIYRWPNQLPEDRQFSGSGLTEAVKLVTHIRLNIDAMAF